MTFLFAIKALLGRFFGAFSGRMALFVTATAGARERAWIEAVSFGVAMVN